MLLNLSVAALMLVVSTAAGLLSIAKTLFILWFLAKTNERMPLPQPISKTEDCFTKLRPLIN